MCKEESIFRLLLNASNHIILGRERLQGSINISFHAQATPRSRIICDSIDKKPHSSTFLSFDNLEDAFYLLFISQILRPNETIPKVNSS
jgi:hypothetical protein